jgi:hypothetical protein
MTAGSSSGELVPSLELPVDDWDPDAYSERFLADVEVGLIEIPPEWPDGFVPTGGLEVSALVPHDACTPDGLKGLDAHGFTGGWAADEMPAGPLLAILAEQAVSDPGLFRPAPVCESQPYEEAARAASVAAGEGSLADIPGVPGIAGARSLTGNELLGAISAAARLSNRAEWMRLALAGELIRRRLAESDILGEERARDSRRRPGLMDPATSVAEELRFQQVLGPREADLQYGMAVSVPARMPALNTRAADGMLSPRQLTAVYRAIGELSDADARLIDAALAPDAHEWTADQLGRRARYLAMRLDPEAADRRKKKGKQEARVDSWQEDSGNAALAGRELDPEVVLAASAYYDSLAQLLRRAGVPGTLTELRALAFADRNTGKDPLDRIYGYRRATADDTDTGHVGDADRAEAAGNREDPGNGENPRDGGNTASEAGEPDAGEDARYGDGVRSGLCDDGYREPPIGWWDDAGDESGGDQDNEPDSFRAVIHLFVSAGTLEGLSGAPGLDSRNGLHGPQATRDLVQAASRHPGTRWRVIFTGADGTAIGHARPPGQHAWTPPCPSGANPPDASRPRGTAGPPSEATSQQPDERIAGLLAWLGVTSFTPIAKDSCEHASRENGYVPGEKLKDLIRARNATCVAPGCGARAVYCDVDHTAPWPAGQTEQCNLGPACRRHHKLKQSRGWKLEQPQPGHFTWTGPSGRAYLTRPTTYDF